MRVAIIGSRELATDIRPSILKHLPASTSEIVSGGARGVDAVAKEVAQELGIPFTEFLPDYETYGKRAPLVRNDRIVEYADMVLGFWDGESRGTQYVIGECLKRGKRIVYIPLKGE